MKASTRRGVLLAVLFTGGATACDATDTPQDFVVCTGWHALCSASFDCRMNGSSATCDCLRVDEPHIVETGAIQDPAARRQTLDACTNEHPCAVDRAPVCDAISHGTYAVDHVSYAWVSTYSYRGWCDLLTPSPVPCDPSAPGYAGDRSWAVCDGAPCTVIPTPSDPERPLSCQCRVENTPFVGPQGRCTGDHGGIISSFPLSAWDFAHNTYRTPMPGYEFVQGACAPLKSDPFDESRRRQ